MIKRNLKNKEIDQIGGKLLRAAKTSNDEIEKIVVNPQLFDSIQARIKAGEQSPIEKPQSPAVWKHLKISFLNRPMAVGAIAVLFIFAVFAGLSLVKNQSESARNVQQPIKSDNQSGVKKAEIRADNQKAETKTDFVDEQAAIKDHAAVKTVNSKTPKRIKRTDLVKAARNAAKNRIKSNSVNQTKNLKEESPRFAKKKPQKIFYSLPFAGGSETAGENLRIVSTELSKSDLFALGVDIQLENEVSGVNAELLVGTDGIARAIRVVE